MRSRPWLTSIALLIGVTVAGFVVVQVSRGEERGLGRGVHFRTIVTQAAETRAENPFPLQIVEEWVSFEPFQWRAEISHIWSGDREIEEHRPAAPIVTKTIFLCDGKEVLLLNESQREVYVVDDRLAAGVREAGRPLLFPQDFMLSALAVGETRDERRRTMQLNGDGYSSVVLETNVAFPEELFQVPAGYRRAGKVRDIQELVSHSGLTWSVTEYSPGVYVPTPPLRDLEDASQRFPENVDIHYLMGMELLSRHDFVGAERELKTAVSLAPTDTATRHALAVLYEIWGKPEAAVAQLEAIVELDPRDHVAWSSLAELYASQGRQQEASRAAKRADMLTPADGVKRR